MRQFSLLICLFLSVQLSIAQVGKVGINTTTPAAGFHVMDSSVLFTGPNPLPANPGPPPVNGTGTRMMWYPQKGALRAGFVVNNNWSRDSIGKCSFASGANNVVKGENSASFGVGNHVSGSNSLALGFGAEVSGLGCIVTGSDCGSAGAFNIVAGHQTIASGSGSIATGWFSQNSGDYSLSFGQQTQTTGNNSICGGSTSMVSGDGSLGIGLQVSVTGDYAMAMGRLGSASASGAFAGGSFGIASGTNSFVHGEFNTASNTNATAFGTFCTASGVNSVALGDNTTAAPFNAFVAGRFNENIPGSPDTWNNSDPLFVLGIGAASTQRKNALTVLKNGKTGILTSTPDAPLHVLFGIPVDGPTVSTATAILENRSGGYLQLSTLNAAENGIVSGNEATAIRGAIAFTADSAIAFRTGGDNTRALLTKAGSMGIGDLTPNARLHVSNGTGGTMYNTNSEMIIEDDDQSYLQFSTPTNEESGILSGNSVSSLRSAIIFRPDSMVQIRAGGGTTRLAVTKNGNIGINTLTPQRLLHVFNGSSGATSHSTSSAVFESSANAVISLLAPNANESAVFFGNPASSTHGGIVYNATPANGLAFRTNGNTTRMVITDTGDVGVGDNSPNGKLHVSKGASGSVYNGGSALVVEDDMPTYVQLASPAANENGIISSSDALSIRAAVMFRADSSLALRSGGNTTRLVITKTGNVGINIGTPTARLHVDGSGLFTGTVTASCGVLSCSDLRYKKNITPISNALGHIMALRGVYYEWDTQNFPDKDFSRDRQVGVIAQELEQHFPELVHTDDKGFKTVDYARMVPVLLEAIKEQQKQIEWLMQQVSSE